MIQCEKKVGGKGGFTVTMNPDKNRYRALPWEEKSVNVQSRQYSYIDCEKQKIKQHHIYYERQITILEFYMQCLLHLNEDFDDDLLLDCINLLID